MPTDGARLNQTKEFMKNKKRRTVIVSALFGVLCLAQTASAFYTPNLQRWVTRDPIEDRAPKIAPVLELYPSELENWPNTFAAMRNSPLNYYDAHGNFAIGLPVIWPIIVEGAKDLLFVCSAVITAVIVRDITKHDCDKEWADARTKCAEELEAIS
jgi:hypothetical protein